jgi:hypothetical protein
VLSCATPTPTTTTTTRESETMMGLLLALSVWLCVGGASWCPPDSALAALNEWMQANAGDEQIAIEAHCYGGAMGVGARVRRTVREGESYASVPVSLVIGEATARSRSAELAALCDLLGAEHGNARVQAMQCMAVYLVLERRDDRDSFWHPYLAALPRSFEQLPVRFDDADVAELQASHVRHAVERARRVFAAHFDALERVMLAHPDLVQPPASFDEFAWASSVVGTRAIWFPDSDAGPIAPHLVPLVDTVNCKQLERAAAVHVSEIEGDAVVTRAQQTFRAGEQLFENYGKPNSHYFWMHGFSMEPNDAFDCVTVPLVFDDPSSDTVCLSVPRLPRVLASYGGSGSAADSLASLVDEFRARYATTIAQDEALLAAVADADAASDVRAFRLRASIAFRLSEKRVLSSVRQELQRMAENTVHQEL